MPGYVAKKGELKKLGIDEVLIFCVNDGAVMKAWAKDQGIGEGFFTMMGDPYSDVTNALGLQLTHAGPLGKGLKNRGKRAAMYIEDGTVKVLNIAEGPGPKGEEDPAGDDFPEVTLAPAMMKAISALNPLLKGEL